MQYYSCLATLSHYAQYKGGVYYTSTRYFVWDCYVRYESPGSISKKKMSVSLVNDKSGESFSYLPDMIDRARENYFVLVLNYVTSRR